MPIAAILMTKLDNDPMNVRRFKNGISRDSLEEMQRVLFEILEKNMKKKIKSMSDEQMIMILAESNEWKGLEEETDYKIGLKPITKSMLTGQKAAPKLVDVQSQLESFLPRLVAVLLETFSDINFVKTLALFNSNSNCKVTYSTQDMYPDFVSFIDRIMRHKQNGYRGYNVSYK